jgi:stage V sporulation protein D (sporulation-specific penicillin-binding protein)
VPHLLSSLQNDVGKTVFSYQTTPAEPALSEKTAKEVAAILEAGVSGDGGAKNAYVEGYHVAAKTGTSEKFEVLDANGNSFLRIGSCVAFAPYDDAQIAVIIVVDEPTSANKYGSAVAAPFISAYLAKALPDAEQAR